MPVGMVSRSGNCVKVVLIPADLHEPLEEQTLTFGEDNEVSVVQDHAKAHFRQLKPSKTAAQLAAQKEALLQQVPEAQRKSITDEVINQALGMDMVEHVALLSNATDNNFTGVTMYCDDEAVAVGLPVNVRASEIASCAGCPSEVRGDVFLARVFDSEEDFKRLDFRLDEVSSSAPWVKQAYAQNERKRRASMQGESLQATAERINRSSKASTRITEVSPAEAEKERGNEAFKRQDYVEAFEHYSKAIELEPSLTVAYNNRAMTRLKLGDWLGAETDCDLVLARDSTSIKALHRRATAREQLGRMAEALQDYREIVLLEPSNKVAAAKVTELESEDVHASA